MSDVEFDSSISCNVCIRIALERIFLGAKIVWCNAYLCESLLCYIEVVNNPQGPFSSQRARSGIHEPA